VNDAVGDIDDKRDCPSDTGADQHVASRPDTCWVRGLVEERPWQAGVVHGVQVDDQVDLRCRTRSPLRCVVGLMVRVHTDFVSHTDQRRKTFVEVTGERDGDMRSPESGPDLEPSLL
jgi:hypothetical protein